MLIILKLRVYIVVIEVVTVFTMFATSRAFLSVKCSAVVGRLSYTRNYIRSFTSSNSLGLSSMTISVNSTHNPVFEERRTSFAQLLPDFPSLHQQLEAQGLQNATAIQKKTIPAILSGADVLIGAETGSGKTLSYMVPLFAKYGLLPLQVANNTDIEIAAPNSTKRHYRGLILAPTNELCNQIHQMTKFLFDSYSPEIVLDRRSDSFFDWVVKNNEHILHITLCTPKTVADAVKTSDHFSTEHPFRALNFLVMDEADMLMDGSYLKDLEHILGKLRLVRRTLIQEGKLSVNANHTQCILSAATIPTYGVKSTKNLIKKIFPRAIELKTGNLHQHHPAISQEYLPLPKPYHLTRKHMDLILSKILSLHQNNSLSTVNQVESLSLGHIKEELQKVTFSTMVFFNTAENARKMYTLFQQAGFGDLVTEVHNLITPKALREQNLQAFRQQLPNDQEQNVPPVKIMCCTDVCARGLDIPHVRFVIQGEFSLNVVQHLHRIGRASRGGRSGFACNIFLEEDNGVLVRSILEGNERSNTESADKNSIEQSFSRNRGFRNKIKKAQKAPLPV